MIGLLTGVAVLLLGIAAALVLPILSFLRSREALKAIRRLEIEVGRLRAEVHALAPAAPPAESSVAPGALAIPTVAVSAPAAPPPVPAPARRQPPASADSLERRIGGRWLLYVGVAAIVVGVSYFVKYAFDNEWITPLARILVGGGLGIALIGGGVRVARSGLPFYGELVAGAGVAVIYLSVYAGFDYYALMTRGTAFALMTAVTAGAAALAGVEGWQGLAVTAVVGGFSTPFLVGGTGRRRCRSSPTTPSWWPARCRSRACGRGRS